MDAPLHHVAKASVCCQLQRGARIGGERFLGWLAPHGCSTVGPEPQRHPHCAAPEPPARRAHAASSSAWPRHSTEISSSLRVSTARCGRAGTSDRSPKNWQAFTSSIRGTDTQSLALGVCAVGSPQPRRCAEGKRRPQPDDTGHRAPAMDSAAAGWKTHGHDVAAIQAAAVVTLPQWPGGLPSWILVYGKKIQRFRLAISGIVPASKAG